MFEALLNELHAQLSSFVNDNPDIFYASGIPTCSRRYGHLESEVPTNLKVHLRFKNQMDGGRYNEVSGLFVCLFVCFYYY